MSWYIVHIPSNQPDMLTDHVDDVTAALAEHYRGPILGMSIEPKDALNAGWCDACPTDCTQCSGDRSSCECYEHDSPEPKDEVPMHPFVPASPRRIRCAAPSPLGAAGMCAQREDDAVHRVSPVAICGSDGAPNCTCGADATTPLGMHRDHCAARRWSHGLPATGTGEAHRG